MGQWINDYALDLGLSMIMHYWDGVYICACDEQPSTANEALATYLLAKSEIDLSSVTPEDGDVSGRKIVIPEKADVSIINSGTATHVALVAYQLTAVFPPPPVISYELAYVTTCEELVLVEGGMVTFPAWKIEIADPTLPE
jgi:hypothetical protein